MDPHIVLALFHVLLVAPFLIYVSVQRTSSPEWLFQLLAALGLFLILYQSYKAFLKWKAGSSAIWINLIHIFVVAPLLLWIGFYGQKTSRAAFELLLLTAFGALGYHLYNLILQLSTVTGGKHQD